MSETTTPFRDAALGILKDIAEHGDETGRGATALVGMLMAHNISQNSATVEAIQASIITRLEQEIAELREENAELRRIARLGITPALYFRLGLDQQDGAA